MGHTTPPFAFGPAKDEIHEKGAEAKVDPLTPDVASRTVGGIQPLSSRKQRLYVMCELEYGTRSKIVSFGIR